MGYFDWIFKYKFDNERQTLLDLRTHTIDWYNQITEPIQPLLAEIQFGQPLSNREQYAEIAKQIFRVKILSGAGTRLDNVLKSMNPRGIPFFAPRAKLSELANQFQKRGLFIKELVIQLDKWERMKSEDQERARREIYDSWQQYEESKDNLLEEINTQIRDLG